jgi:hypothetical protein
VVADDRFQHGELSSEFARVDQAVCASGRGDDGLQLPHFQLERHEKAARLAVVMKLGIASIRRKRGKSIVETIRAGIN